MAAPPADPKALDLTPPEGMSERAATRWAQLTERVKVVPELERRATEAETALSSVRQMVTRSGLAPDEFQDMLEIGRLFKSSTPTDLKAALERVDQLRTDLATRLGVDAPGADPLVKHPDLQAKVDGMTLSRADALEIVRLRTATAAAEARQTAAQRSEQEVATYQQTVQSAAQQMDAALAERAATPGHAERVAFIRSHFSNPANLQTFVATYQPTQWKAALLMMYDAHVPAPKAPPPAAPQPLRPSSAALGRPVSNGQPVTAQSAVAGAFERLGL